MRNAGADIFFYAWPECESKGLGSDMQDVIRREIMRSDFVLMICTPEYKRKAETSDTWVNEEYSVITKQIFRQGMGKVTFIPILRQGVAGDSIPSFFHEDVRVGRLDFTTGARIRTGYKSLHHRIFGRTPELDSTEAHRADHINVTRKSISNFELSTDYTVLSGSFFSACHHWPRSAFRYSFVHSAIR